jgi:hypothetical protein
MVVAPPQIWWPNTNSSNHSEHGTVGWSFKLQRNGGGGWSTFKETSVQKATAYEDQDNPYGAGTKAPFSKLQRNVDTSNSAHYDWRAIIKATWYKAGGGVLGSVTHRVYYYKEKAGDFVGEISSSCPGSII